MNTRAGSGNGQRRHRPRSPDSGSSISASPRFPPGPAPRWIGVESTLAAMMDWLDEYAVEQLLLADIRVARSPNSVRSCAIRPARSLCLGRICAPSLGDGAARGVAGARPTRRAPSRGSDRVGSRSDSRLLVVLAVGQHRRGCAPASPTTPCASASPQGRHDRPRSVGVRR